MGPKKFIAYTEDLANVISRSQLRHHLYADDTQLFKPACLTEILPVIETSQRCVQEISETSLCMLAKRGSGQLVLCVTLAFFLMKN